MPTYECGDLGINELREWSEEWFSSQKRCFFPQRSALMETFAGNTKARGMLSWETEPWKASRDMVWGFSTINFTFQLYLIFDLQIYGRVWKLGMFLPIP